MRDASPGQFHVRALLLAACAVVLPAIAQAQEGTVPDTHTVREGDTLWDIAKRYFGDPFTWPQVYKLNTAVVEDPHWIYPGEVLRLKGDGVAAVPPDTMQVVPQAVPPVEVVQAAPDTAAAAPDSAAVPTDTILVAGDSIPARPPASRRGRSRAIRSHSSANASRRPRWPRRCTPTPIAAIVRFGPVSSTPLGS